MHNELVERRKSWIDTDNKLREMRDANEPQILKQSETEKAAKKLRERSERFEKMMAVRLKLLIQSIHASESEKVALQQDLAREQQNFQGWKAATDSCYLAFKTIPKSLREKPPEFPPSGNVRTALEYLEQQSRISGDMQGAVEVLQRQMNELSDLTLSDSPEQELTEVREELSRENATLTQRASKESLTQRKSEKDREMAELKASLESKEEERDTAKKELKKMEDACKGIARELRKIPGTNHHRRRRLEDLRGDGHLSEDVFKVWEAISTATETFEGHVYGPLFLHIRPKDKYNDATSIKAMETIFGYKTLRSFLVDSPETCNAMMQRFNVREGRKISIAFMRSRIDMPPLDDDTLANYRRYGFSTVLDKMYDAPPLVKQYLQQAFTSQAILFTKKPPKTSSVPIVIDYWKTASAEKDRLVFCTDQNLYEVVKVNSDEVRIHEQPLKEAHLLKYETADVATQNERLQEMNTQFDDKEAERNKYKDYLRELETKIADLYDEIAVLEDDSQKISSDLEELEEVTRNIATLQTKIHNMSHVDLKPSLVRLQEMAREIREKNRLRLKLLCASENGAHTPLAKLQVPLRGFVMVAHEVSN
ncbi:hypothetical protein RvY_14087-2 [Ramazzottius varieornatus]|uniref:SMC hinge domain-containing protein n=1 Tax=Ramazzottius varieornatus TaxID=947166 RepID=A0A1D1VQ40_RAMVA|nr:hypothetical protein RvY_14087-2 [Ramazzottius varieornatus]